MEFFYNSTNGGKRKLPDETVQALREYLERHDIKPGFEKGKLHDLLVDFHRQNGTRLMINQLEPVFIYVANTGSLWPAEAVTQ